LRRAYRGRAIVTLRPQAACPYIALDESWLEPEQHMNSGRRSDLRRARRKAEQLGDVNTEIRTPDLDELPELLDTAFEVEANSWKGDAGTALEHDAHRAVFYRQFAEAACVEGILRICFLRIGDRPAAMQLALEQGGGFWLLKVGYDQRFANCSPGQLLMRDTIRYAAEAGLASYEFLGRAESWTDVWTKTKHQYVSVRVYPFGLRGLAALVADGTVMAYQRWKKKPCV
jgi:CelD/BcsL family acetyltransferase involved in cellulose biosynthesis